MKKKFYFATLVITALSFTGCANDEYVGEQQKLDEQNGAIAFSTKSTNTVRGTTNYPGAPEKLHNTFWVYGTKTVKDNNIDKEQIVFKDYKVVYQSGTASSSNTRGWEYVGIAGTPQTQTIKYWDYSAEKYDFQAYSFQQEGSGTVSRNLTADVDKKLDVGDYEVATVNENECANLYFAGQKTVKDNYKDIVTLDFKSVLSKIRVGFYETIPGYSVKIDKFYGPADGENPTAWDEGNTSQFVAWCPNNKIDGTMSFVVSYNDNTPAITKVKQNDKYRLISNADGDYTLNQELTLGSNLKKDKVIGETYSKVTWDRLVVNTTNPDYTYVIPQNDEGLWSGGGGKVQPMKIKVDYTLTSTDGSKEEIHVKGATAIVPKEYVRWKPNTAYSYVFKISDNTNGSTGTDPDDPAGLYPITFDAFVTEMAENDYLTTVSDLSITATQGKQFAEADKAAFNTDQEIKVKVMRYDDHGAASDITYLFTSNQTDYQFSAAFVSGKTYDYNKSQEDNLNGQTLDSKNPADGNNYITLEGKSAGFWIVKVTYKAGNETIIKYAVLKVGTETTPPSQEGGQG